MLARRGSTEGARLMRRTGASLFILLIVVYWGIGLNFSFAYGLMNEAQARQTVFNYMWELPALGIPLGVVIPLLLLRPVARDYDRMLAGQPLENPEATLGRLLSYPRRIVWYFTPASLVAYFLGSIQSLYLQNLPFDEFLKGLPLGLPLGLLLSLAAYFLLVHYLDPVRREFTQRHGYLPQTKPPTSVYRKVVITSITILMLSMALLWLIAYSQGQTLLEDQLFARMDQTMLPSALDAAAHPEDPTSAARLRAGHLGDRGYTFVVDERGRVLTEHPGGATDLAAEGWDETQRSAVLGQGGHFADRSRIVRLVAFMQVPGTSNHAVVVTYRDDFAAPLADMTQAMLGATFLGLAVAVVLTLTGARAMTRPIRELTEAMRRARDDGSGGEVSLLTDDEVGTLAASYAGMMSRLQDKTRALAANVEEMAAMDAMKTQFINIASHELRTPMTPIRTELHLLRTGKRGPLTPEQERGMAMVARNVDRLNRLIRDLLEASRLQAGRLKLILKPMNVGQVVRAATHTMENEARAKGLILDATVPPDLWAEADEDRVSQVLINLLENAIQFTPEGGHVSLSAIEEDGFARVEVRDSGSGVEEQALKRLFQPFSQAEPGVPRTEGGTGLGLFICKGIIEGHGGRIWGRSDGKGRGSTFTFTLPLRTDVPALHEDGAPTGEARIKDVPVVRLAGSGLAGAGLAGAGLEAAGRAPAAVARESSAPPFTSSGP